MIPISLPTKANIFKIELWYTNGKGLTRTEIPRFWNNSIISTINDAIILWLWKLLHGNCLNAGKLMVQSVWMNVWVFESSQSHQHVSFDYLHAITDNIWSNNSNIDLKQDSLLVSIFLLLISCFFFCCIVHHTQVKVSSALLFSSS